MDDEDDLPTSDDEWTLSLDPDDDEITQPPHPLNNTPQTSSNDGIKIMTNIRRENLPKNLDNNNGKMQREWLFCTIPK